MSSKNRRRFKRKSVSLEALFKKSSGPQLRCDIKDYCAGGLLIEVFASSMSEHKLSMDEFVESEMIHLQLNIGNQTFEAEAEIAHIKGYYLGVQFTEPYITLIRAFQKLTQKQSDKQPFIEQCRVNSEHFQEQERDRIFKKMANTSTVFIEDSLMNFFQEFRKMQFSPTGVNKKYDYNRYQQALEVVNFISEEIFDLFKEKVSSYFDDFSLGNIIQHEDKKTDELALVDKDEFEKWLHFKVASNTAEENAKESLVALQSRINYVLGADTAIQANVLAPDCVSNVLVTSLESYDINSDSIKLIVESFKAQVLEKLANLYQELNGILEEENVLPGNNLQRYLIEKERKNLNMSSTVTENKIENDTLGLSSDIDHAQHVDIASKMGSHNAVEGVDDSPELKKANVQKDIQSASIAYNKISSIEKDNQAQKSDQAEVSNKAGEFDESVQQKQCQPGSREQFHKKDKLTTQDENSVGLVATTDTASEQSLDRTRALAQAAFASAKNLLRLQQSYSLAKKDSSQYTKNEESCELELDVLLESMTALQKTLADKTVLDPNDLDKLVLDHLMKSHGVSKVLSESHFHALNVVKKLFLAINENALLSKKTKCRLSLMSIPVFKALLIDPTVLTDDNKPIKKMINKIALVGMKGCILSNQNEAFLNKAVAHVLKNYDTDFGSMNQVLPGVEAIIQQHTKVFEHNIVRVKEACTGQHKILKTKCMVEEVLFSVLSKKPVPPIVFEFLDVGWKDLMHYSLLKGGESSDDWKLSKVVLEDFITVLNNKNVKLEALRLTPTKILHFMRKGFEKITNKQYEQKRFLDGVPPYLTKEKSINPVTCMEYTRRKIEGDYDVDAYLKSLSEQNVDDRYVLHYKKWVNRVKMLTVGDWLSFENDENFLLAGRLVWKTEENDKFVFVNRQGMKMFEYLLPDLVEALLKGKAYVIATEDLPIIEQGLDSLVQVIYAELTHGAMHDELTGLVNHKEFVRVLGRELVKLKDSEIEHVVCYFRFDQINVVNASCGYDVGDELIKELSESLFKSLKPQNVCARLSDNEFALLLFNASEERAFRVAHELLSKIVDYRFYWKEKSYSVSCDIGLLEINEKYSEAQKVLRDVESACSMAEESGRNGVQIFNSGDSSLAHRQKIISWVNEIDQILDEGSIRLKALLINPIQKNEASSLENIQKPLLPHYEVLIGTLKEGELDVSPLEFVCAAERYNRMQKIDCWVIAHVFQWMARHPEKVSILGGFSINLSGHSLNDENLMKFIFESFSRTNIPCEKICFEITETAAVASLNDAADFINELKNMGCLFALDDFGTGMSSFSYLKHLPVDYIKIDGSFVKDMIRNEQDHAMVKSITDMGHLLGKAVVAEYVHTEEILHKVQALGVDYAQGFFVEKPIWLDSM